MTKKAEFVVFQRASGWCELVDKEFIYVIPSELESPKYGVTYE